MQKAGTGWLYKAFNKIDGFRMLPIKEFHHFDGLGNTGQVAQESHKKHIRKQMASRRGGLSLQSRMRLSKAVKIYINSGFSTSAYLNLFEENRNWLTGDMTPSYSVLEPADVAHVHEVLPNRPVVLSVRHPVDRLWSSFNMYLRRQIRSGNVETTGSLQKDLDREATSERLEEFLAKPKILARSKPSVSHDAWSIYGDDLIVVSLDEIITRPKELMESLATRLLGRETVLPDNFQIDNNKGSNAKVRMSAPHRTVLFEAFAAEIQTCKKRFPEIAEDWKTG
jgi:hypothetical protein